MNKWIAFLVGYRAQIIAGITSLVGIATMAGWLTPELKDQVLGLADQGLTQLIGLLTFLGGAYGFFMAIKGRNTQKALDENTKLTKELLEGKGGPPK